MTGFFVFVLFFVFLLFTSGLTLGQAREVRARKSLLLPRLLLPKLPLLSETFFTTILLTLTSFKHKDLVRVEEERHGQPGVP